MPRRLLVTVAIMVGLFVAALDQTIVGTAFPKIVGELGEADRFTWVTTAYLVTSTAILPVVGRLADRYGRKRFWTLGVALFVGGSVLCGQAETMGQLIFFRGVQGIGGGMVSPMAQTIIGDLYSGRERARMQGLFAGLFALASVVGPLVGGWIADALHWKYIFLINLPTGALALLLSAWGMREEVSPARSGVEQSVPDMRLFKSRTFTVTSLIALVLGGCKFAVLLFFPWFLQGALGASATDSGTVLLPMTLALVAGSVLGGLLAPRLAYRWQIGLGLGFGAAGFLRAARFTAATTLWDARAAIILLGFGLGLVQPILIVAVQEAFGPGLRGRVTAANAFCRSIGSIVGVSVFGALFNGWMGAQAGRLGPAVLEALGAVAERPSDWVQVLLEPRLQEQIPAEIRMAAVEAVREMMVHATRSVFGVAAGIMLAGMLAAQFLRGSVDSGVELTETGRNLAERR